MGHRFPRIVILSGGGNAVLRCAFGRLSLILALVLSSAASYAGAPDDAELRCTTPYFAAAARNDVSALNRLLASGTKVNTASDEGFTALICAADSGSADAAKLLLEKGANPNSCTYEEHFCPLWYAATQNHADLVGLLIDKGAKLEDRNGWGDQTALAWAVRIGKADAAKVLVDKGASLVPVIKDEYYGGKTALQLAKKDGHTAVVKLIETAAGKSSERTR